jgi:tetratricopeptide (TPR) repeat protein
MEKNDYDSGDLFQSRRNNTDGYPTLTTLGLLFQNIGDFKRATQCFQQHLNVSEVGDTILPSTCYHNLGNIAGKNGDYNKALEILTNLRLENTPEFAQRLGNIGTIYSLKDDYRTALLHMTKALDIERKILPNNHVSLATSYNNIALAYAGAEKFDLALENLKNAQGIFQVALPTDHPTIRDVAKNIELVKTIIQLKCI